jgi:hypothetical protein
LQAFTLCDAIETHLTMLSADPDACAIRDDGSL